MMALEHTWRHDGSLQLTIRQEKRVNGEKTDNWHRIVVPAEDVGRLRHLLALGPPPRSGEADDGLVAGEGLEGPNRVAGVNTKPHSGH